MRLVEIHAKCDPSQLGSLEPSVELDCKPGTFSNAQMDVICDYTFTVRSGETKIADATIKYLLSYDLTGADTPADSDVLEFARANGALHSWPFVRELLYGLTSRMGYPPYTLPTMHFKGAPKIEASEPVAEEVKK